MIQKINKFLFEQTNFLDKIRLTKIIAIFCIINLIVIAPDMYEIYGNKGLISPDLNSYFLSWYQPVLSWITDVFVNLGLSQNFSLLLVFFIYLVSLISIVLGKNRVFFSIVAWIIHLMMVNSSYMFSYGADYFISLVLFINVFISISTVLKGELSITIYSFFIRFLQVHMCLVYFFAGFGKILGTDWFDGNALWLVLSAHAPSTINYLTPLLSFPIIFKVLSWSVFFEQLVYPIMIYVPRVRKHMLITTIVLHIFIAIFMNFYTFAGIMILLNYVAFGHYLHNGKSFVIKPLKRKFYKTSRAT